MGQRDTNFTARMYSLPPMHASPEPPAPLDGSAKGSSLRIVVVDDERDTVLSTVLLLRECGHLVRGVYRGAQALQVVGAFAADAVLLDIAIPDVNGYQLARALRARYGKRCPLLIAVTAHDEEADKQRAREAGFDHHLAKPYDPIALLARLEPLAARRNRAATLSKARFGIKLVNGVLRAELVERETEEETATFLHALVAESKRTRC